MGGMSPNGNYSALPGPQSKSWIAWLQERVNSIFDELIAGAIGGGIALGFDKYGAALKNKIDEIAYFLCIWGIILVAASFLLWVYHSVIRKSPKWETQINLLAVVTISLIATGCVTIIDHYMDDNGDKSQSPVSTPIVASITPALTPSPSPTDTPIPPTPTDTPIPPTPIPYVHLTTGACGPNAPGTVISNNARCGGNGQRPTSHPIHELTNTNPLFLLESVDSKQDWVEVRINWPGSALELEGVPDNTVYEWCIIGVSDDVLKQKVDDLVGLASVGDCITDQWCP